MDIQTVIKKYKEGLSPYEIAEWYNSIGIKCYANKIRRCLQRSGVILRSKSDAQKEALEHGRMQHPTKGRKRTTAEKLKISQSISDTWKNLSDEERRQRSQISKDKWDRMTQEEKEALKSAAARAIRQSAETGSKIEKYLLVELRKLNYKVDFHSRSILYTQKLQVDLFLPEVNSGVVIEVDGPSHFEPVWGQEALERTLLADQEKNGLLLGRGFVVIRLRTSASNISLAYQKRLLDKLVAVLDNIKDKGRLPIEERLIYIGDN